MKLHLARAFFACALIVLASFAGSVGASASPRRATLNGQGAQDGLTSALQARVNSLALQEIGIEGVKALPLAGLSPRKPLWVVYSYGMRSFDPLQTHFVELYTYSVTTGWRLLGRQDLADADYVDESSVRQEHISSNRVWFSMESGVGAHSGLFDLFSYDGKTLKLEVADGNSSPYAGEVTDVNGDGVPDVLLNHTENYVFCYACGIRFFSYDVMRWDGNRLVKMQLAPLSASAPAQARNLAATAIKQAEGNLWKDAQANIGQAIKLAPNDPAAVWDAALIRLHAEAFHEQAQSTGEGSYPLLTDVFYGDYAAALNTMRPYTTAQVFATQDSPLIASTVAENWESELSSWMTQTTTSALQAQPDLAPAYFLRGWATHLSDPSNPSALADIQHAAQLDAGEALYQRAVAYFKKR